MNTIKEFIILTELRMAETPFTTKRLALQWVTPLSSFQLFSNNFEQEIKSSSKIFPEIWHRLYIDDNFTVVGAEFDIENFIHLINNKYPFIKFTHELANKTIPFLDLLLTNMVDNLSLSIEKNTYINNYIILRAHTYFKYKNSVFNSLFHNLFKIGVSFKTNKLLLLFTIPLSISKNI